MNLSAVISCTVPVLMGAASFGQNHATVRDVVCYNSVVDTSREIFAKTEVPASYKGQSGLATFLTQQVNFFQLSPHPVDKLITDTASVQFIVHRDGTMSNLTVEKTGCEHFKSELTRVIKQSACSWQPGSFSMMTVTSWVRLDIFYSIERKPDNVSLNVGLKRTRPATDSMNRKQRDNDNNANNRANRSRNSRRVFAF